MILIRRLSILIVSVILVGCSSKPAPTEPPKAEVQKDIYVSVQGNDNNAGTDEKPLQTLEKAIELAKGVEGATIWLSGGTYKPSTIYLDASNSGTADSPFTIRAIEGENVVVSGGEAIDSNSFNLVSNEQELSRLKAESRGKVYSASLEDTDLHQYFTYRPDYGKDESYALVSWNGYVLQQACWPNKGYDFISETLEEGPTTRWLELDEKPAEYSIDNPTGAKFKVRGSLDMEALKKEFDVTKDMCTFGYHSNDWFYQRENIGAIDSENDVLQLLRYTRYGVGNEKLPLPRRIKLVNVLCELDQPGEWYYDYNAKKFYIWPVQPISNEIPIKICGGPKFIAAKDAEHINVLNIIFENFGKEAVSFENCNNITVAGCTFRSGIDLALRLVDGKHNTIDSCDFHDVHRAFLLLGDYESDIKYETPYTSDINFEYNMSKYSYNRRDQIDEHNVATNNHIHHCRLRGYGLCGIGGVGAQFTHNLVHNINGGIMYGHNDFLAEYNEFYDVGYEMGDWNVLYCGADLTFYNNMIRFNFAHHLIETPKGHPMSAWRADDNASGLKTFGNIYYKCGRSATQGNGPESTIENSIAMDTRYYWWTVQKPYHAISFDEMLAEQHEKLEDTAKAIADGKMSPFDKDNIVGKVEILLGKEGWKNNKAWVDKYPNLPKIFGNLNDRHSCPWVQCYNYVRNNYSDYTDYNTFHIHGRNPLKSYEDQRAFLPNTTILEAPHKVDREAMFVDSDNMDFRMKDDFKPVDGFVKIPFEEIGLKVSQYRKTVPNKNEYRNTIKDKYKDTPSYGGKFDYDTINDRYPDPEYLKLDK